MKDITVEEVYKQLPFGKRVALMGALRKYEQDEKILNSNKVPLKVAAKFLGKELKKDDTADSMWEEIKKK